MAKDKDKPPTAEELVAARDKEIKALRPDDVLDMLVESITQGHSGHHDTLRRWHALRHPPETPEEGGEE